MEQDYQVIERCINKRTDEYPTIELSITRVESYVWTTLGFDNYHYMTRAMNKAATSFVIKNIEGDSIVGFISFLPHFGYRIKKSVRVSRLVILPDFQGLGLSKKILDFFGGIYKSIRENMYIKTIHPKIGRLLQNNENFKPTGQNSKIRNINKSREKVYKGALDRESFCFKYIGKPIDGYKEFLYDSSSMRRNTLFKNQLSLF